MTTVEFNDLQTTNYGDAVYISGNVAQLGNWDTSNAVPLNADSYTSSNNLWSINVQFPTNTAIQYKYFVKASSGTIYWESGSNR